MAKLAGFSQNYQTTEFPVISISIALMVILSINIYTIQK